MRSSPINLFFKNLPLGVGVFPLGVGVFPLGVGVFPLGVEVFPLGVGVFPLGIGVFPLGVGVFPLGVGFFSMGVGVFPLGVGVFPLGVGVFPLGIGVFPLGVGVFPLGVEVFPLGVEVFPLGSLVKCSWSGVRMAPPSKGSLPKEERPCLQPANPRLCPRPQLPLYGRGGGTINSWGKGEDCLCDPFGNCLQTSPAIPDPFQPSNDLERGATESS
uniref:Uncharacterized protein n=1 Tax=Eptatretus burgeri TaxID=7764 RepID=A0A8C4Q6K8_EPTBU